MDRYIFLDRAFIRVRERSYPCITPEYFKNKIGSCLVIQKQLNHVVDIIIFGTSLLYYSNWNHVSGAIWTSAYFHSNQLLYNRALVIIDMWIKTNALYI